MRKIDPRRIRLTKEEREIEAELLRGEWVPVSKARFEAARQALIRRRKDAVLSIRVNSQDLADIKRKAKKLGVPYQSFVSELLHQYAVGD